MRRATSHSVRYFAVPFNASLFVAARWCTTGAAAPPPPPTDAAEPTPSTPVKSAASSSSNSTTTPLKLNTTPLETFGRFAIYDEGNHVWRVEMLDPKGRNAMDDTYFDALHATFDYVSHADADVRACVLHGPLGGHFSVGLNLKWAGQHLMRDVPMTQGAMLVMKTALGMKSCDLSEPGMPAMRGMAVRQLIERFQQSITAIAECRVPVIAAVSKMCLGGGVNVVSACDMRFASNDAVFSIKEANVGIVCDLGALQRTSRIVGEGVLREWAYTGRNIPAAEAARRQFVNDVFDTPEACLAHALKVGTEIATASSPIAVQGAKEVMNYTAEKEHRDGLQHVKLWNSAFLKSTDLIEAATAFGSKRKAAFDGAARVLEDRPTTPRRAQKLKGTVPKKKREE